MTERIRASNLYSVAAQLPKANRDLAIVQSVIQSLAIASDYAAREMEAEVRAEFAKEIADGVV